MLVDGIGGGTLHTAEGERMPHGNVDLTVSDDPVHPPRVAKDRRLPPPVPVVEKDQGRNSEPGCGVRQVPLGFDGDTGTGFGELVLLLG